MRKPSVQSINRLVRWVLAVVMSLLMADRLRYPYLAGMWFADILLTHFLRPKKVISHKRVYRRSRRNPQRTLQRDLAYLEYLYSLTPPRKKPEA